MRALQFICRCHIAEDAKHGILSSRGEEGDLICVNMYVIPRMQAELIASSWTEEVRSPVVKLKC